MTTNLKIALTSLLFFTITSAIGQNYQAMHGSSYGGSLTVYNNPASIVHVPYVWDVTPVAVQAKHSTNAFVIKNASLLSSFGGSVVTPVTGTAERFFMANQDMRLLNASVRLSDVSAFAIGASVRAYQSVKTSKYNWQDTMLSVTHFMDANTDNTPIRAEMRATAFAEVFGTYSRTIIESENGILNAGITMKVSRGLGGGYLSGNDLSYITGSVNGQKTYLVNGGSAGYGYSSNFDEFDKAGTAAEKRKQFLKKTWSALAFSIGAEYILPSNNDEDGYYDYDVKLGVSLLDIGSNKYQYGTNSINAVLSTTNVTDSVLDATFRDVANFNDLPDSIQTVAGSSSLLSGGFFSIYQPARLVLNADKKITDKLYVNAELTLPLTSLAGESKLYVREMNLAALTTRYETKRVGFYLPATLNSRMQFWLGGAVRFGPLLLGVHNWSNVFAKNKMQNGGAYFALTLRPGNKRNKRDENNYGTERSGREKSNKSRGYGCPPVR